MKILITTHQDAFLHKGGGEFEIALIKKVLTKCNFIVEIYGQNTFNINEYNIVLHFSVHGSGLELLKKIRSFNKYIILIPNFYKDDNFNAYDIVNEHIILVDKIAFKSNAMMKHFSSIFPISPEKIILMPYFLLDYKLDNNKINLFKDMYCLDNYIISIGIIERNKNQLTLIKVIKELNLKLVLIGKSRDYEYLQECKNEASNNVIFIDKLYYGSDLMLSALKGSLFYAELSIEPAGYSALEAARNGVKLLINDSEWSKEIFGKEAEYVDVNNPKSIKEAISRILNSPQDTNKLKNTVKKYSLEKSLKQFTNLLETFSIKGRVKKILVVQRYSMSNGALLSRSTSARFVHLLNFLSKNNKISWEQLIDKDITFKDLVNYDFVLFNKHMSKKSIEILNQSKKLGIKVIYDIDDNFFNLPKYSFTELNSKDLENAIKMITNSDYITVSTIQLQDIILNKFSKKAVLLPISFDHNDIKIENMIREESQKILFSNTDSLKLINFKNDFIDTLKSFFTKYPHLKLDFWGDIFPELEKIPNLEKKGHLENKVYKQAIMKERYLFAIVPLGSLEDPETLDFNNSKSNVKFVDYSSLKIPAIYSNIAVYSDVVKNEETGLIVNNNSEEWFNAMEKLLLDANLRSKIRENAYEHSLKYFKLENVADIFLNIINGE